MNDEKKLTPAALAALASGDFGNAIVAATPGGIERQESAGQASMSAQFQTLPKDIDRSVAEAFGFEFGEDADDIFVSVKAPNGWIIRPTDHSMHSDIVDEKGRTRGSIFYKAAFYDRRADGHWACRFKVESEYVDYEVVAFKAIDTATGEILFKQAVPTCEDQSQKYQQRDAVEGLVAKKLDEKFPNYRDPKSYWDDEPAKAIEAGTAKTGTGLVHESAVGETDLPKE